VWRWRRSALTVGVDASWLVPGHAGALLPVAHGATQRGPWHAPDAQALQAALAALLDGRPRTKLRVLLGADLCRHWVLPLPGGLRSWSDLQALAQARAAALFNTTAAANGSSPDWTVAADWRACGPQWCVAVPTAWISALRQAAATCGVRLHLLPALQLAWQRLQVAGLSRGLLAWTTPGHLLLAQADELGRVQAWRSLRCPAMSDEEAAVLAVAEARALAVAQSGLPIAPSALQLMVTSPTLAGGTFAAVPAEHRDPSAGAPIAELRRMAAPWAAPGDALPASEAAWAAAMDGGGA